MRIIYTAEHAAHAPDGFIMRGTRHASPEVPERARIFLDAVTAAGHDIAEPDTHSLEPVKRVHDASYLDFLETAWDRWSKLPGHAPEIIPNIHSSRNMSARPDHIVGLAGIYQTDTACPIGPGTWRGALATAQCAITAAREVMQDGGVRYALCRPPGHHAFADMAGGFCFLNNSAIAAQLCRDMGASRVAVLDVDVHHGNGTQGIFYSRSDVLTVSLHGDPSVYYPFFAGYEGETGEADGQGYNLNIPLAQGTNDSDYLVQLTVALKRIRDFAPDILVVAAGLDASEHDPLAFLGITTSGFASIGKAIAHLNLPTVLVQEGGYICDALGANLAAFLSGFESGYSGE